MTSFLQNERVQGWICAKLGLPNPVHVKFLAYRAGVLADLTLTQSRDSALAKVTARRIKQTLEKLK